VRLAVAARQDVLDNRSALTLNRELCLPTVAALATIYIGILHVLARRGIVVDILSEGAVALSESRAAQVRGSREMPLSR
jgi:hypothetical protein